MMEGILLPEAMHERATGTEGRAPRRPVFVLVGPTASGKTDLLLGLFGARAAGLPPAEAVSADSMQAYRGMDIGTAKPSPAELARLPHHLIDIKDPEEPWSAGEFVRGADEACEAIRARDALPVVAGGTGFYVRNFVFGLPGAPEPEPRVREAVAAELAGRGLEALWEELLAADPAAVERMHPNNRPRIQRAIEILRQTGRPPSDFAPADMARSDHDFLVAWVSRPREELYRRIEVRVDLMFERGLPAEVDRLVAQGHGPESPGMKAIGYSEFFEAGTPGPAGYAGLSKAELAGIAEAIKQDTRRYAKRQETFFRSLPAAARLELSGPGWLDEGVARLSRLLGDFLGD